MKFRLPGSTNERNSCACSIEIVIVGVGVAGQQGKMRDPKVFYAHEETLPLRNWPRSFCLNHLQSQ